MDTNKIMREKDLIADCPVYAIQDIDDETLCYITVEGLWFTAEEAQLFIDQHRAHGSTMLSQNARVYSYPARGELKTIIKAHTKD